MFLRKLKALALLVLLSMETYSACCMLFLEGISSRSDHGVDSP